MTTSDREARVRLLNEMLQTAVEEYFTTEPEIGWAEASEAYIEAVEAWAVAEVAEARARAACRAAIGAGTMTPKLDRELVQASVAADAADALFSARADSLAQAGAAWLRWYAEGGGHWKGAK